LKILNTKRAGGVAQGVGPEFKPQYHHQKKKKDFSKMVVATCSEESQVGIKSACWI
jgi:hypothetical protein